MRLPASLAIIPALVLFSGGFCPQTNSQTKPIQKDPDASVSGKVTVKGKPVAGIVVGMRLSQPGQFDPTFKAITDQNGKYRIDLVPAGNFEVAPVATALVVPDVNNPMSQAVLITEGERVEGIDFALVRGGVITGTITDADGRPLIEERVNLFPVDQSNPARSAYPLQINFQTDDRGIYRLFGIRPGKYKVSIGDSVNNFYGNVARGRAGPRTTFYPDATDPAKATVIEVGEGTEATGIDITLSRQNEQRFSVSGRVVDEGGRPVYNVGIALSRIVIVSPNHTSSHGGASAARSDSQGAFLLEKLPPGKYSVSIEQTQESEMLAEPVTFDVLDQDVTGLVIKGSIRASLSGVVVLEGARDKGGLSALAGAWVSVSISNEAAHFTSSHSAQMKPDGSFRIVGLQPGIARLSIDTPGIPGGARWVTTSRIERDGVVQPNGVPIQAAEQVTGLRVIVTYSSGRIRGAIKVVNGTLPPGARWSVQLIKPGDRGSNLTVTVDSRGHFVVEGLADGNYELRVFSYVPGSSQRPASTKQIVTVNEGATSEVTVTLDLTNPNP